MRHSARFSASGFVLTLLKSVVSGKASFNQLAITLKVGEIKSLTRQALWKRINSKAVSFMMEVTGQAIRERWITDELVVSPIFSRVLVEDSSQAKLPKDNHEEFPAHGNGQGETAGCKFDLAFDLLTGEPISIPLHLATAQDRELGKDLVDLVKEGDLVLRDMGYFSFPEFERIESLRAYWLSRLPANVKLWDASGVKLETILRKTKANRIEFDALVGEARRPARFIAVRATAPVAEKKRRERRAQARKLGKAPNQDMLVRDGWHLIITNIGADLMEAADLFKLYSIRWQIEITFRAWKQSAHLVKALARRSNPFHLQVIMYSAILLLIPTMKTASLLQCIERHRHLSIEKIADDLALFVLGLSSLLYFSDYNPDPRHIRMDRRSRKSLREIAICHLS